jgi:hypothetical protein
MADMALAIREKGEDKCNPKTGHSLNGNNVTWEAIN